MADRKPPVANARLSDLLHAWRCQTS